MYADAWNCPGCGSYFTVFPQKMWAHKPFHKLQYPTTWQEAVEALHPPYVTILSANALNNSSTSTS